MATEKQDPHAPSQVFGRQVKEARRRLGRMTQADLGVRLRELGVSARQEKIARLEAGERRVTLDDALAVAVALGVQPAYLLSGYLTEEPIRLVPVLREPLESREAWEWLRGARALEQLAQTNADDYFAVLPDEERVVQQHRGIQTMEELLTDLRDALRRYANASDAMRKRVAAAEVGEAIHYMSREVERQRDENEREQRRLGLAIAEHVPTGEENDDA